MSEPIRVLQLFTIMNRGGAETMIMNYYRNMDRTKVQLDFMVHREQRGAYDDEIEALGGRIYRMLPIWPQNFRKYKKQLKAFFQEHKEYRVIHSNMSELGYYAFKEASKHGKVTLICHAHSAPRSHNMQRIVRAYFKRRIRKYTTDNFTCSQEAGDWLFGKKQRDSFVQMNNAVDSDQYAFSEKVRDEARKEFNFTPEDFVIGHVGRLARMKNHKFLFEVFREVAQRRKAKLLIVGTGYLEQELKNYAQMLGIANDVIFTGIRPDVNRVLQAMDVFVFPSKYEGLPLALVEAQAADLPCVISDRIPPQTILVDNVSTLSLSDSPSHWTDVILSKHSQERQNKKSNIVAAGFDIESNVRWLEKFYQDSYRRNVDMIENIHAVERG